MVATAATTTIAATTAPAETDGSSISKIDSTKMMMNTAKKSKSQRQWERFRKLKWDTPYPFAIPHGYAGLCSWICGSYLLYKSHVQSTLSVYGTIVPYQYVFFTVMNAVGGYLITYKASPQLRLAFKVGSVSQCVSCYYILRFLPSFYTRVPFPLLQFMDRAMIIPFSFVNVGFLYGAYVIYKQRPLVAMATVIGAIATWTTYSYPINLLIDSHWLECIMTHRYPMEDIALVSYVYVPATLCFSAILFGATLLNHRIISDFTLGVIGSICIIGTVFVNLLIQEIQVTDITGLQIIMPCPAPEPGTWAHTFEVWTDSRNFFRTLLSTSIAQHLVDLAGIVKITDHTSYRPNAAE
jgi:hypothetical protein